MTKREIADRFEKLINDSGSMGHGIFWHGAKKLFVFREEAKKLIEEIRADPDEVSTAHVPAPQPPKASQP